MRGVTLIELVVALVILAVGLLALATTIPLFNRIVGAGDAEEYATEARSCAEVLIWLHEAPGDVLEPDCNQDPGAAWLDQDNADAANYEALLVEVCGEDAPVEVTCDPVNGDYELEMQDSANRLAPIFLRIPES